MANWWDNPRSIPARPTTYNGIDMRSRLEARFAEFMDGHWGKMPYVYESRAFGSRDGQYLPDFEITGFERRVFIEVRPTAEGVLKAFSQMPIIWASEPKALLLVTTPHEGGWFVARVVGGGLDPTELSGIKGHVWNCSCCLYRELMAKAYAIT